MENFMTFAIWRQNHPPPLSQFFNPIFVLLLLNLTEMKRILHLVPIDNVIFKSSSCDWFKIDIFRLLRPTALYCGLEITPYRNAKNNGKFDLKSRPLKKGNR